MNAEDEKLNLISSELVRSLSSHDPPFLPTALPAPFSLRRHTLLIYLQRTVVPAMKKTGGKSINNVDVLRQIGVKVTFSLTRNGAEARLVSELLEDPWTPELWEDHNEPHQWGVQSFVCRNIRFPGGRPRVISLKNDRRQ